MINPATGELVASVARASPAEAREVVERARAAQPAWRELGFRGRAEVMLRLRAWLIAERERLIGTASAEAGRAYEDVLFGELFAVAEMLGFWARRAETYLAPRRVRSRSMVAIGRRLQVRYEARGVIGVIAPWNFPLALGFGDSIPALMAGNSVALKPSGMTPLGSLLIEEGWREVGGPPEVFRVLTGRGDVGSALVESADMIMFTGSARTGRGILAAAAERLIPVSLELGGKDPMIVLEDADLDRAASLAVQFAFWNSGQLCMAVERVYAVEAVYDEFVSKVLAKTRALRQGHASRPGAFEVGAMILEEQAEIVEAQLDDAIEKGARVLTGGRRLQGAGRFIEPTILVEVDHTMDVMTEETFGPVLPIASVRNADEAVALANDTRYGLNSSVFTRDLKRGARVAARIEAGSTCVNDVVVNAGIGDLPFGATKESGLGGRNAAGGIRKYCSEHAIVVSGRLSWTLNPLRWPVTERRTRMIERALALLWGRGGGRWDRRAGR